MLRLLKKQGFTLIELMVVIVIIGVLASLAIPRFTEASSKAKVAEAPRVIASWESAFLALAAEVGDIAASHSDQLIFDQSAVNLDSKWFSYSAVTGSASVAGCSATPKAKVGIIEANNKLFAQYNTAGAFDHSAVTTSAWRKYTPNFFR